MAIREVLLTDEKWKRIQPLIPPRPRSSRGGRPPADDRRCFEGILWVLKTGARGTPSRACSCMPSALLSRKAGGSPSQGIPWFTIHNAVNFPGAILLHAAYWDFAVPWLLTLNP